MSRGRPRTAIGTFGEIALTDLGNRYRASTRYRDLDGRLRRVTATARSARAAEAELKARLVERPRHGGGGVLGAGSAFGDLCELWLADLELRDISEGSKHNYRDDLRLHVRPAFDAYTLGEITTGRVEWFLKQQAAISYSRAKHLRTLLNQVFTFALRHDAMTRNPVEGTSPLARPKHEVHALSLEQVHALRAAAAAWRTGTGVRGPRPDGKVRDICEVLLGTSLRPGEVLALRPCDVTEASAGMVIHVRGTVVRRAGVADFRQDHPKTHASNRRLAVPEFAAEVIRRRMALMGPEEREVTIFHNRDGGVLTLHNLRRTFREFVKDAGLDGLGITPRWYRRTGATVIARGLGLDSAAAFLGHTSTAVTEEHYVAVDQMIDRSPARVLELTLRPIDADGRLLSASGGAKEDELLDEIDDDAETGDVAR
ncbi:tyrosine-type recombinase/integrase [Cellulomonas cellasea]|uniref:Integrase n=1 Tax=Cellulomonas cellasea TaxID=43670 RepID=A0A7W4UCH2_9CELL|nr:tyrosine-type recombinase/integrase [Cellulomonas cellasea]MBB2921244.1 integrase [Cellulomonas cellasea]